MLALVLRSPGPQTLRQGPPELIETSIRHLQDATDIGRLAPIEKQVGRRGVGIAAVLALEHPQRYQRVEEIRRAPRVQTQSLAQSLAIKSSRIRELRKDAKLDSAQQRLRAPEREPQLHDRVRRYLWRTPDCSGLCLAHRCTPFGQTKDTCLRNLCPRPARRQQNSPPVPGSPLSKLESGDGPVGKQPFDRSGRLDDRRAIRRARDACSNSFG